MDAVVLATLICSGAAAAFSGLAVMLQINSQRANEDAAARLEKRTRWTPPSPPR